MTDKEVDLWYPGNDEALHYNRQLRAVSESATAQFVSDQEYQAKKIGARARRVTRGDEPEMLMAAADFAGFEDAGSGMVADEFSRKTQHTKPRTLTLDTKYEGAPKIQVWTGYAHHGREG